MRSRTKASFPDCTEFCRVEIPARTQRCLSKIAHRYWGRAVLDCLGMTAHGPKWMCNSAVQYLALLLPSETSLGSNAKECDE
jgi:hypothetical protein